MELPPSYTRGALFHGNTFSHCVSRYGGTALSLRASHSPSDAQSCSGFYLDSNLFLMNQIFGTESGLVSIACHPSYISQVDSVDDLSLDEIKAYEATALTSATPSLVQGSSNSFSYLDL